jgi:hypothetical protein
MLHMTGSRNDEIADITGFSYGRVSQILNDERALLIIQANSGRVADALMDVRERLKLYSHEALDEIVDEMRTAPDPKIRQKAAFGVLDRAGYSPVRMVAEGGTEDPGDSVIGSITERVQQAMAAMDKTKEIVYEIPEEKPANGT